MKAIRVHEGGGPEVLRLEEVGDPSVGPGEVLVRMKAAGVNPVETYIRAGGYMPVTYPYTPGSDGAGEVAAVGDGVTSVKPGDRVYTTGSLTGTYAELALCQETQVHPLPDACDFTQGAALYVPYCTAYRALFQLGHARPGDAVLIHGASGGVGTAAVQWAAAAGCEVFGTAGTENGRKLVAELGAHHVLNHTEAGYLDKGLELTGGSGFTVIIEMLANVNLMKDLSVVAKGGRIIVVGNRGTLEFNARDAMRRDATITGMLLFNAPEDAMRESYAALFAGLSQRTLRPVIGQKFALADAPRAHEAVMAPGSQGKIVLLP